MDGRLQLIAVCFPPDNVVLLLTSSVPRPVTVTEGESFSLTIEKNFLSEVPIEISFTIGGVQLFDTPSAG